MAGMISSNADTQRLIRAEVYSSELKDILRDEMQAQRYVRMLDGFPDGDSFTIPTIGKTQKMLQLRTHRWTQLSSLSQLTSTCSLQHT